MSQEARSESEWAERRRDTRFDADFDVLLVRQGSQPVECRVLNVCLYGCRLEVGDHQAPDDFHLIDIVTNRACRAEVRWRHGTLVGVRFTDGWRLAADYAPLWLKAAAEAHRRDKKVIRFGVRPPEKDWTQPRDD